MQVKCTSCGASQNISQAQNCDFCGNVIELESAKNNYQSFLNGESGNLMAMAETAIEATNWEEALQYFNRVLEKDITNSDAWLGKGIAIVYTSKIGDIKITEAIAYWKNALKHAPNQEAMGKRVAKEINSVVNAFYPSLENHFIQFKDLDNSYGELVAKFVILEKAIDYATKLDSTNIKYCETGYALCSRVIQIPKQYALADESAAWAQGIIGAVQQNKYKTQDAVQQRNKAKAMQEEINKAALIINKLVEKYQALIKNIDPNYSHKVDNDGDEIIKLLIQGKKLAAVKLQKELTGMGLKESKEYVEQLAKENNLEGVVASNGKGGCFIATAAMGDYDHPVVCDLRFFRDNWLLKRNWGVNFTNWYYTYGPKAATVIEKSIFLRKLIYICILKPLQIITKKLR